MSGSILRAIAMGVCISAFASGVAVISSAGLVFSAADPTLWGEDPFGPPPGAPDGPSGGGEPVAPAELQGVIAGPSGMVAIIDDRIVRIGDRVGAELVEEITPRAVVLRRGSQVRRLAISVLPTHER